MSRSTTLSVEMSTSTAHRLLNYDGVCSCVHGHNIGWKLELTLEYEVNNTDNMSVDFKNVSDIVDETDHALLLNNDDPLLEDEEVELQSNPIVDWTPYETPDLGSVLVFDGDPTCEVLSDWLAARMILELPGVYSCSVDVAETDKYSISTKVFKPDIVSDADWIDADLFPGGFDDE